jgi:hypothetical protein
MLSIPIEEEQVECFVRIPGDRWRPESVFDVGLFYIGDTEVFKAEEESFDLG